MILHMFVNVLTMFDNDINISQIPYFVKTEMRKYSQKAENVQNREILRRYVCS